MAEPASLLRPAPKPAAGDLLSAVPTAPSPLRVPMAPAAPNLQPPVEGGPFTLPTDRPSEGRWIPMPPRTVEAPASPASIRYKPEQARKVLAAGKTLAGSTERAAATGALLTGDPYGVDVAEIRAEKEGSVWDRLANALEPFDVPRRLAWHTYAWAGQALPNEGPAAEGLKGAHERVVSLGVKAAEEAHRRLLDIGAAEVGAALRLAGKPEAAGELAARYAASKEASQRDEVAHEQEIRNAARAFYDALANGKLVERSSARSEPVEWLFIQDLPNLSGHDVLDLALPKDRAARLRDTTTDLGEKLLWSALTTDTGRLVYGLIPELIYDPLNFVGVGAGSKVIHVGDEALRVTPMILRAGDALNAARRTEGLVGTREIITAVREGKVGALTAPAIESLSADIGRLRGVAETVNGWRRNPAGALATAREAVGATERAVAALDTSAPAGEVASAQARLAGLRRWTAALGPTDESAERAIALVAQRARTEQQAAEAGRDALRALEMTAGSRLGQLGHVSEAGFGTLRVPFGLLGDRGIAISPFLRPLWRPLGAAADVAKGYAPAALAAKLKGVPYARAGEVLSPGEALAWSFYRAGDALPGVGPYVVAAKNAAAWALEMPQVGWSVLGRLFGPRTFLPSIIHLMKSRSLQKMEAEAPLPGRAILGGDRWRKVPKPLRSLWDAYHAAVGRFMAALDAGGLNILRATKRVLKAAKLAAEGRGSTMQEVLDETFEAYERGYGRLQGDLRHLQPTVEELRRLTVEAQRQVGVPLDQVRQALVGIVRKAQGDPAQFESLARAFYDADALFRHLVGSPEEVWGARFDEAMRRWWERAPTVTPAESDAARRMRELMASAVQAARPRLPDVPGAVDGRTLEKWEAELWRDAKVATADLSDIDGMYAVMGVLQDAALLTRDLEGVETWMKLYSRGGKPGDLIGRRFGELRPDLAPIIEHLSEILKKYEALYREKGLVRVADPVEMARSWGVIEYLPHIEDAKSLTARGKLGAAMNLLGEASKTREGATVDEILSTAMDARRARKIAGTIAEVNAAANTPVRFGTDPLLILARLAQANRAISAQDFLLTLIRGGVVQVVRTTPGGPSAVQIVAERGLIPLLEKGEFARSWDILVRGLRGELKAAGITAEDASAALRSLRSRAKGGFATWMREIPLIQQGEDIEEMALKLRVHDMDTGSGNLDALLGEVARLRTAEGGEGLGVRQAWDAVARQFNDAAHRVGSDRKTHGVALRAYFAEDGGLPEMFVPAAVAQSMDDLFNMEKWVPKGAVAVWGKKVLDAISRFFKLRYTVINVAFHGRNKAYNDLASMVDVGPFGLLNPRTQYHASLIPLAAHYIGEYGSLEKAHSALIAPRQVGESLFAFRHRQASYETGFKASGLEHAWAEGLDIGDGVVRPVDDIVAELEQRGVLTGAYTSLADLSVIQHELADILHEGTASTLWARTKAILTVGGIDPEDVAVQLITLPMTGGIPVALPKAWGGAVAHSIENQSRIANFIANLRRGTSWDDAGLHVGKTLFNYTDMNAFQKIWMRTLIPFWCVPEDHEILTKRGWKRWDEVKIGEPIMGFNPETYIMRWEPLEDVATFRFDGFLRNIERCGGSFQCTDDHRWPVQTTRSFAKGKWYGGERKIKRAAELNSSDTLPLRCEFDDAEAPSILSPRHAAILGWIVSDGYGRWRGNHWEAHVYQLPTNPKGTYEVLLRLLGTNPQKPHPDTGVVVIPVALADKKIITEVYREKVDLPALVTRLSREAAEAMWLAMFAAEGSTGRGVEEFFAQRAGPVLEAFQILSYMTGRAAWIYKRGASIRRAKFLHLAHLRGAESAEYHGTIWCPRTPSGMWLMRHDGAVIPTGNTWPSKNLWLQLDTLLNRPIVYQWYHQFLIDDGPAIAEAAAQEAEGRPATLRQMDDPDRLRWMDPHTRGRLRFAVPGLHNVYLQGFGSPLEAGFELFGDIRAALTPSKWAAFFDRGDLDVFRLNAMGHFFLRNVLELWSGYHYYYGKPISELNNARVIAQTLAGLRRWADVPVVGELAEWLASNLEVKTRFHQILLRDPRSGMLVPFPIAAPRANYLFNSANPWSRPVLNGAAASDVYQLSLVNPSAIEETGLPDVSARPSWTRYLDAEFAISVIQEDEHYQRRRREAEVARETAERMHERGQTQALEIPVIPK